MSVLDAGNILREDFTFRHTFSPEVSKLLKAKSGQVVMVQPEKFHSKHEPGSRKLSMTVTILPFSHLHVLFCQFQYRCQNSCVVQVLIFLPTYLNSRALTFESSRTPRRYQK